MLCLVVPLVFIIDFLVAWRVNSTIKTFDFLLLIAFGLWLTFGVGVFILVRVWRRVPTRWLQKPLIAIYVFYLMLLIVEVVLPANFVSPNLQAGWMRNQQVNNVASQASLWPPNRYQLLWPDEKFVPGISGQTKFTVNEFGLRGIPLPQGHDAFKIVAVGGSTTEVLYLDDSEAWPHLLMENLNEESGIPVWVANAGQSGRSTVDHLVLLDAMPFLADADMLIFLIGINDLTPALALKGSSTQDMLERKAANFRQDLFRWSSQPFSKRTKLYQLSENAAQNAALEIRGRSLSPTQTRTGHWYDVERAKRAKGPRVKLPDLSTGFAEYRSRVRDLARRCDELETRCLFVTQPTMWRADLSPREESLLWVGWVGQLTAPVGYGSPGQLRQAMDSYNYQLLNVCRRDGLECFDLASLMPADTSAFYDDFHFNENGSRIVARLLTDYLLSISPFEDDVERKFASTNAIRE